MLGLFFGHKNVCITRINLVGMGIGDGWMSPYHNARYANQLYQVRIEFYKSETIVKALLQSNSKML